MKINVSEGEFQLVPEGLWPATLKAYTDEGKKPDRYKPGKERHTLKLIWQVYANGIMYELWDFVTFTMTPKSDLYAVARALLRTKPTGVVDTDDLVGKSGQLQIEHKPGLDGTMRAKVIAYLPASNGQPKAVITDDDLPDFAK